MNSAETRAVRRNFAKLVKEVKAMDMLDDLFACGVIDMDDFQRVTGQLADSDKMRKLLEAILTKKVCPVNIFHGFVVALENINRSDLAEDLLSTYQSEMEALQNSDSDSRCTNSIVNDSTGGSLRVTGEFEFHSAVDQGVGMDVTDNVSQTALNKHTAQPVLSAGVLSSELPAPRPSTAGGCDMKVSERDLREAAKSVKGKSGSITVADRILEYEIKGLYDVGHGQLTWKIKLVDQSSQTCVEKICKGDRFEEIYNCIVELLAIP